MEKPIKSNEMWDIHQFYDTIGHTHLSYLDDDFLIDLCLVECSNGHWFIVDDTSVFKSQPEFFNMYSSEFIEPAFFTDEIATKEFAILAISKVTGQSIESLKELYLED